MPVLQRAGLWVVAMNPGTFIELFLAGISLGMGPCFLFCAPVLFPFIVLRGRQWRKGLNLIILFSAGRVLAYCILAILATVFIKTIGVDKMVFRQIAGVFIIFIVVFDFLKPGAGVCGFIGRRLAAAHDINMFLLGLLIGLAPCAPLIGVLTYIAAKSDNIFAGLLGGLSFGIGTFFPPAVILSVSAGLVSLIAAGTGRYFRILKIISSAVLVYFGIRLLL